MAQLARNERVVSCGLSEGESSNMFTYCFKKNDKQFKFETRHVSTVPLAFSVDTEHKVLQVEFIISKYMLIMIKRNNLL